MSDERTFRLTGVICTRSTPKAILVVLTSGASLWVPQSQVHADSEVWQQGDEGALVITRWLAEQKGLIEPEDKEDAGDWWNPNDGGRPL